VNRFAASGSIRIKSGRRDRCRAHPPDEAAYPRAVGANEDPQHPRVGGESLEIFSETPGSLLADQKRHEGESQAATAQHDSEERRPAGLSESLLAAIDLPLVFLAQKGEFTIHHPERPGSLRQR
jgi:hypothetical protein